jgi:uncharacterized protein (DUF2147 family)
MKKLLAMATLLLASTAAQAQYTFEYGGHTIRIDPDRGTVQIPGVYDNTGQGKAKKAKSDAKAAPKVDGKADQARIDAQQPASPSAAVPPAAEPAPAPAAASPAPPATPPAPTTAPADNALAPPAPPPPAAAQQTVTPAVPVPPAVAAAPPAPPAPAPPTAPPVQTATAAPTAAPTRDLNSPLGVWLTEEKEGKVRIEQCGSNLCGYSVDAKSNQNGEQILINMKPGKDQKWSGRILDPNSGSTYDSTIAMRGTDRLRVQGCAFGGMFCGGQTWTRVN